MNERYESIAAYFKVNGIKVSKLRVDKPIPPMNFLDMQLETTHIGISMRLINGERLYIPIPDYNKLGIPKHLEGELKRK